MNTTTSYGTWCNQINTYSLGPDSDVLNYINGGGHDWENLLLVSGSLARIKAAYRDAINNALPYGVSLSGNDFIGPAYPDDDEWDGFPTRDHDGRLDIKAIVDSVDLAEIVEAHDVITGYEIGRDLMGSKSKTPANVANIQMKRLGIKPVAVEQIIPGRGRYVSIYNRAQVTAALANRPGSGNRTPRKPADKPGWCPGCDDCTTAEETSK